MIFWHWIFTSKDKKAHTEPEKKIEMNEISPKFWECQIKNIWIKHLRCMANVVPRWQWTQLNPSLLPGLCCSVLGGNVAWSIMVLLSEFGTGLSCKVAHFLFSLNIPREELPQFVNLQCCEYVWMIKRDWVVSL